MCAEEEEKSPKILWARPRNPERQVPREHPALAKGFTRTNTPGFSIGHKLEKRAPEILEITV